MFDYEPRVGDLPRVGEDVAFDRLFTAATLVRYAYLSSRGASSVSLAEAYSARLDACPTAFTAETGNTKSTGEDPDLVDATGQPRSLEPITVDRLQTAQLQHPGCNDIISYLSTNLTSTGEAATNSFKSQCAHYHLDQGILMHRTERTGISRIVLPLALQPTVFRAYHDRMGHQGFRKCAPLILARYYWDTAEQMATDIADYIAGCRVCAQIKIPHHKGGSGHIISCGEHPHDYLGADVYSTGLEYDKYDHTISFMCYFSRHVTCEATRGSPDSKEIARVLVNRVMRHYGKPRLIRSDHGSVFVSRAIAALYEHFGITMKAGTAYHHQTVGLVERWHSCLKHLIMAHCKATGATNWTEFLPLLELSFNAAVNTSTGYSPFFVVFGREAVLPEDLARELPKEVSDLPGWVQDALTRLHVTYDAVAQKLYTNALNRLKAYDLRHDPNVQFKAGDRVLLIKGKFVDGNLPKASYPTEGPFTICRALPKGNYQLMDLHTRRLHDVVSVDRLLAWPTRKVQQSEYTLDQFPVKDIVGHTTRNTGDTDLGRPRGIPTVYYRIRLRGGRQDIWRSIEYLSDILPLVQAYRERKGLSVGDPAAEMVRSRIKDDRPPVSLDAQKQKHFRSRRQPLNIISEVGVNADRTEHATDSQPNEEEEFNTRDFEVLNVLDARRRGNGAQVLIQWRPSWVPWNLLPESRLKEAYAKLIETHTNIEMPEVNLGTFQESEVAAIQSVRVQGVASSVEALVEWTNTWIGLSALTSAAQAEATAILIRKDSEKPIEERPVGTRHSSRLSSLYAIGTF